MQALLVFKARFFGAHLSGAGFISWGAQLGFKPFTAQGEALGSKFPPDCWSLQQGWISWQNCVPDSPTNFDERLPSFIQCTGVTQTAFRFFPEEVVLYYLQVWSVYGWR